MPVRTPPARPSSDGAAHGDMQPDDQLAVADYSLFAQHHAIGRNLVIQCVWIYEHAINFDGLRRFQRNLGYGLLGRRIERSPLPFARPRWVLDRGPSDIDIAESARPREKLSDWADERSQVSIDPEGGPGWHLGVLPLTGGASAVSLVLSHYLVDGLGLAVTVADAVLGNTRDLGYSPPCSRSRRRALLQDARQTARDAPQVARALVAAAKLARHSQLGTSQRPASRPAALGGDGDDIVVVPTITLHIDRDEWDTRAGALGGTSNTLVAGFAAKLGERLGRRREGDGAVTLQLPISERAEGDTRANAMSFATVRVDPTEVTTDLRDVRTAIKQALKTLRETPNESLQVLWLASLTPERAWKRLSDAMSADPDLPVFCSNLGEFPPVVCQLDGTESELVMTRVTAQHEKRQWLERTGGQMTLQSWRIRNKVRVSVGAYQPGVENTKPALRELAAQTLAEFGLSGEID